MNIALGPSGRMMRALPRWRRSCRRAHRPPFASWVAISFTQRFEDGLVYEDIQPGGSASGMVVFNVPAKRAAGLTKNGNLVVKQFSDTDVFSDRPKKRLGIIRTYN